eukprot:CAMPEP_0175897040 /NCGR_PEP_ID=MMETSP0108-20121206/496_1 /TAXON_ID=195067 ORGANISM="Goniomonas pacifica, Strain CCMP1869" /NCGR_SAMPLE_ID=MMETSP0108 /ASSEMBLY_ACC=CAM_ASM_000204 /LENGTH=76 /DNA_ID=CAMNT_0017218289 /DNA_START=471 /DNA_END=698 /DNA_ORIENTATION=+
MSSLIAKLLRKYEEPKDTCRSASNAVHFADTSATVPSNTSASVAFGMARKDDNRVCVAALSPLNTPTKPVAGPGGI